MSMRIYPQEFLDSVVTREDIEREPELYPKELMRAFERLDKYNRAQEELLISLKNRPYQEYENGCK